MKRLLRILLVLFVLLLLGAGAAFLGLRWYVQSPQGTARLQAELGKAIDMPLAVHHVTFGWGGLRLYNVRIAGDEHPFLTAPVFTAHVQLAPLLHRQVVLHKMVLDQPTVIWPQEASGKWVLPTRPKGPSAATPSTPKAPGEKSFQVALETLEIRNGTIEMQDFFNERFARMEGVQALVSLADRAAITADVQATNISLLKDGPVFEKVWVPFAYKAGMLTFPGFTGTLGGGTVKGRLSMATKTEDEPYDLTLALDQVELARAVADPAWQIRSGQLQVNLTVHGSSKKNDRRLGRGEIRLTQASVDSMEPLLRLIGEMFNVAELANLNLSLQNNIGTFAQTLGVPEVLSLKEASTAFQLTKKETVIERLLVDGGDLAVQVKGTINQDGKLKLNANLNVSEKLKEKLPTLVTHSLVAMDQGDRYGIDFDVTGKNNSPKTNLFDKVLSQKIPDQIGELLGNLFQRKDKEKKENSDVPDEEKRDKKKKKDKDKEKEMTDPEKKGKKEKDKDKEKAKQKAKEEEMAQGATPDANPIPPPPPAPAESAPPAPVPPSPEPAPVPIPAPAPPAPEFTPVPPPPTPAPEPAPAPPAPATPAPASAETN